MFVTATHVVEGILVCDYAGDRFSPFYVRSEELRRSTVTLRMANADGSWEDCSVAVMITAWYGSLGAALLSLLISIVSTVL